MKVVGDNWDREIFSVLAGSPPPEHRSLQHRHEFVINLIISTVGDSLRSFLRENIGKIAAVAGRTADDPVHMYIDWMGSYYLLMHDLMRGRRPQDVPGWQLSVRALDDLVGTQRPTIIVTFQLGLPLLAPLLIQAGSNRPTAVVIHTHNEFAIQFLREHVPRVRLHNVEDVSPFELLTSMREGRLLLANVDTVYPGTRRDSLAFFDGRLDIPGGLFLLGRRAGAQLRCFAAPYASDGLRVRLSRAVDLRREPKSRQLAAVQQFFEPLVAQYPYQWMGWAGVEGALSTYGAGASR